MFVLKQISYGSKGKYTTVHQEAICVSESIDSLKKFHAKNIGGDLFVMESVPHFQAKPKCVIETITSL